MQASEGPIEITGIGKKYEENFVLRNVSLRLSPGEVFGLIGLNGAGKTTLIKILLNLISATEGQAFLYGIPVTDPASRKALSYLPEKFQPSRYLEGYEFLELSLAYYGRKLKRADAANWAERLDLDPGVLSRRVGTYSKGMGQKLGLAAAFLIDTPLLVLDEPMSGLDPRARIKLKNALLEARKAGKTVFFSSHILSDIDEICDRIGIIHEGAHLFTGTPREFKARHGETSLERAFLSQISPEKDAA